MILLLTLLSSVLVYAGPVRDTKNDDDLASLYLLPADSTPSFYDIVLFLDPENEDYFYGNVTIDVLANVNTRVITMHAMAMTIDSVRIYRESNPEEDLFEYYDLTTDDTQLLRIYLREEMILAQEYIVHIDYTAEFADNMFGVYVSKYYYEGYNRSLIVSQFAPTYARRAFPCYDEPAIKAIFRTTIHAPPGYTSVRSNMPLRADLLKDNVDGFVKYEFEDTPLMSSYLMAFMVSALGYAESAPNPIYRVPLTIFSRPETQSTAAFAMDIGQTSMIALENYTDFPYALPKLDKAAVPEFAAGAMENWGLIVYREIALLVSEGVTTTATKQNIGKIICHENVHQWFGNEVSPQAWEFTWLSEGFATFFENYITDSLLTEWRLMDQFVLTTQNVFQTDAVASVNAMNHPVYTPSQILGNFNSIAYQKSGAVIRMLQHIVTPEVFRRGLIRYLKEKSRAAATPQDLFLALQIEILSSEVNLPGALATVMATWTDQAGFPVITVERTGLANDSVYISQERFFTDPSITTNDFHFWFVPINWALSTSTDFSDTTPQGWLRQNFIPTEIEIPGISQASWYIINKQQTGYYRVNYEVENWVALSEQLNENHDVIHTLNRAQILDDAFNLARNGRLDYNYAFEISRYLVNEVDYIPWGAVNPAYTYLNMVLSGSKEYILFQHYLLNLTEPLYNALGFDANENEEHVTPFLRNILLDINCRHGNERCINRAKELLENYRNEPINPDIQTIVYCSALRGGDEDNFSFLWEMYLASSDSSQQSILLNALGCTSNDTLRTFYLNQVINDDSPVKEQDKDTVIISVINSSPENMEAALDFVIYNFHLIQPRVQGLTGTASIFNAFSRRLTTQAHSDKIDELYIRHQDILTAGEESAIAGIRENIAASIAWNENYADVVEEWLIQNFDPERDSASSVSCGLLLAISLFVAVFN